MLMLTIETFLLFLLSGLLGIAVGRLVGCGGADLWSADRPWLREAAVAPPVPVLPTAPILIDDADRTRLAAMAESHGAAAPIAAPPPVPETPVVPVPPAPPVAELAADAAMPEAVESVPEPTVDVPTVSAEAPVVPTPAPTEPGASDGMAAEPAAAAIVPPVAPEDAARAAEADAVGTRPSALAAPLGGKADDLKRIRGIGPQNERRLNALGVFHFAQIAAWTAENAKWAGSFLAFQGRIEREDWIGQAKVLATGAETDFSKRVDAGDVPTSRSDAKN